MVNELQKYEPVYEICLNDDRVFYLPRDKFLEFNKKVLDPNVWILYIDGYGFNKKKIDSINPPSSTLNPLKHCSPDVAAKVKARIQKYKSNLSGQLPNVETIVKWIEKAKNGETL